VACSKSLKEDSKILFQLNKQILVIRDLKTGSWGQKVGSMYYIHTAGLPDGLF
jgi:hypothetical protein